VGAGWSARGTTTSELSHLATVRMCIFLNGSLILFLCLSILYFYCVKIMFYSTFYDQELKVNPALCSLYFELISLGEPNL
jgi:hypothetical protein